ncbi:MAG TPA: hypothetical protein VKR06_02430 [Ktedonosporobacter sp.]|nr:hypothetical protein [Ktedonosporobacter sp.]
MKLRDFWTLPTGEQEQIRETAACETEEEHQAFLNALFPAHGSFEEADQIYDLSDTHGNEHPA